MNATDRQSLGQIAADRGQRDAQVAAGGRAAACSSGSARSGGNLTDQRADDGVSDVIHPASGVLVPLAISMRTRT